MLLMLAQPVSAGISTGDIEDDAGDADKWFNQHKAIPDYLDITCAVLTLDTDSEEFTMTMEMAADIPDKPALFNGMQTLGWQWCFRAGHGSHPFGHWLTTDEDYQVWVMWNGKTWYAQLWDFVDNQGSGMPLVRDIQEFGHEDIVSVTIPSSWIDIYDGLSWAVGVKGFMAPPLVIDGFYGSCYVDWAGLDPNTGDMTDWPEE